MAETPTRSHAAGTRARRAVTHRRPARGHGVHVAVQPCLRAPAGRAVHPAHRGHRPGEVRRPTARRRSSRPCTGSGLDWDEGPDKGGPFAPYRQSERSARYDVHVATAARGRPRLLLLVHDRPAGRDAHGAAEGQAADRLRPALPRQDPRGARRAAGLQRQAGGAHADPRRRAARLRRRHPRRGQGASTRRPGHHQGRRAADLPPRQRRRRPRDGHHPRRPRRGVDLVDAQARAALRLARLAAPGVRAHAVAAQHRQVEDLQAEEPRRATHVVPGAGLSPRGAASTSSR